jgi:hypothetical protein
VANVTARQICLDGPRNFVVKFTGVLDTADIALTPALALADAVNNEPGQILRGFRLDKASFSLSENLKLSVAWQATATQQMIQVSRTGHIKACAFGGFCPNTAAAGYTGGINLTSMGWATIQTYTLLLELIKVYK